MHHRTPILLIRVILAIVAIGFCSVVSAHGDVQPQAVDTTGLDPLGDEWLEANPYRNNTVAIEIGESAYTQNCARCHGLAAVSGGMSPDLRMLPPGDEGDEFYMPVARKGVIRNGMTYMPAYEDVLNQEALWAIRSWLETVHVEE